MEKKFNSSIIFHDVIYENSEKEKRLSFLKLGALFFSIISGIWILIPLYIGDYIVAFVSFIILISMCFVFYLLRADKIDFAAHILLFVTLLWISFIVIVLQGNHQIYPISTHHWLLIYVMGMQFLLIDEKKYRIFIHFILALSLFILFEFRIIHFPPLIYDQKTYPIFLIFGILVTPITIVAALIFFSQLFSNKLSNAEERFLKTNKQLDLLLRNLLPDEIATKIVKEGKTFAEAFSECSVIFVKILGFEKKYESDDFQKAIRSLEEVFSEFDRIAESYGLVRIKTIGDSYMLVAGAPKLRENHAIVINQFALNLKEIIKNYDGLNIRIGINSGPVVAGLIGKHGLIYDLWGDTVNVASRMESHGVIGEIQISQNTKEMLGGRFIIEERGEIQIKGKGKLPIYLVKGYKQVIKETI